MGMYCCCENKISSDNFICNCDWQGWTSRYDWPPERKNKDLPFSEPPKSGKYLVRIQTQCGDRYEDESRYSPIARIVECGYTGKDVIVYWEGNDEEQPYAWKELEMTK